MAHSIDVLSKKYIQKNEIIQKIESISEEKGFFAFIEEKGIHITKSNTFTFEINFLEKEKYEDLLKNDNYWGKEFGILFYIIVLGLDVDEDFYTVPFLKELLQEFPDFLLFNEEVPEGNPFVYTKSHLDAFTSNLFYETLQKPPIDLNKLE